MMFLLISNLALAERQELGRFILWVTSPVNFLTASGVLVTTSILTDRMNDVKNRIEKIPAVTPNDFITRDNNKEDMNHMMNLAYIGTVAAALGVMMPALILRANYIQQDNISSTLSVLYLISIVANTIATALAINQMKYSCKMQKVCLESVDLEITPEERAAIVWYVLRGVAYVGSIVSLSGAAMLKRR